jgi:hypothetical protein
MDQVCEGDIFPNATLEACARDTGIASAANTSKNMEIVCVNFIDDLLRNLGSVLRPAERTGSDEFAVR